MVRSDIITTTELVLISTRYEVVSPFLVLFGSVFRCSFLRTKRDNYVKLERMYVEVCWIGVEHHQASDKGPDDSRIRTLHEVEEHGFSVVWNEQTQEGAKADSNDTEHYGSESGIDVG